MKEKGVLGLEIDEQYDLEKIDFPALKAEVDDVRPDDILYYDFVLAYFYGKYQRGLLMVGDLTIDKGNVIHLIEKPGDIEFAERRFNATWYVARLKKSN